jgi:hypothetical protein
MVLDIFIALGGLFVLATFGVICYGFGWEAGFEEGVAHCDRMEFYRSQG